MKVIELLELENKIEGIKARITDAANKTLSEKGEVLHIPFEFTYALSKNSKKITAFRKEKIFPFNKEVDKIKKEENAEELEKKALKATEKLATPNDNGIYEYVMDSKGLRVAKVVGEENLKKRDAVIAKLTKEYSGLFDKLDELNKSYKEFIDSELEGFDFYEIKMKFIPDIILPDEMDSIIDLIKEDE